MVSGLVVRVQEDLQGTLAYPLASSRGYAPRVW